ncbi:MAG TPA: hypothetical protein VMT52_02630 [Planctomycetota bacterium]|jgi:hypothetical protein|nr:hypothetical protein [Planctomycetota bacterium]
MQAFGRFLQVLGLVIVPTALFYYAFGRGRATESQLMFGELGLLALGALVFLVGRSLQRP